MFRPLSVETSLEQHRGTRIFLLSLTNRIEAKNV